MTMNGMIYKIELNEENIYVGSTTEKLCRRQSKHNYALKKKTHLKLYKTCIENNIDYIKCIWIADCEYNSIAELRKIEEDYRKKLNCNLNMKKCYSTEADRKKYLKEYYEENKDNKKEYNEKYREKNRSKINENNKEYYEENKSKISEKSKKKITCEKCNSIMRKDSLLRHQKSMKCLLLSECLFSDSD